MRPTLVAALCAILCAGPTAAVAQEDDDWEFAEDPTQHLSVAAVRYDAGKSVIVQCREGELKLVISGMPETTATQRILDATRPDGRADTQRWTVLPGGALTSTVVGRDTRFLRGGGSYDVRSRAGETPSMRASFDLPTQNANLDRVLIACGRSLTEERDALPRAPDALVSVPPRRNAPEMSQAERSSARVTSSVDLSCIVRDLQLTDCRVEYERSVGRTSSARLVRLTNGARMQGVDAAAAEGTVVYMSSSTIETRVILAR